MRVTLIFWLRWRSTRTFKNRGNQGSRVSSVPCWNRFIGISWIPDWNYQITGWWVRTFFIFPYIGNFIIPIDFHIFQCGRSTTNQMIIKMVNPAINDQIGWFNYWLEGGGWWICTRMDKALVCWICAGPISMVNHNLWSRTNHVWITYHHCIILLVLCIPL